MKTDIHVRLIVSRGLKIVFLLETQIMLLFHNKKIL